MTPETGMTPETENLTDTDLRLLSSGGIAADAVDDVRALPGGVSSRVLRVTSADRAVIVKQARAELTVGDGWTADVERTRIEARFTRVLNEIAPRHAVALLATDDASNSVLLESAPTGSAPWKAELLAGRADPDLGRAVGTLLAAVHGADDETAGAFVDRHHLETLRIAPYLEWIEPRHPALRPRLRTAAELLRAPGGRLVHGDFSPKNILITPDRIPLLIDHEVAHRGAPAFDVAFLATHLLLKAVHRPVSSRALGAVLDAFLAAYRTGDGAIDDAEAGLLTAALLLARIDGRSPVDYLTPAEQDTVRDLSTDLLSTRAGMREVVAAVLDLTGPSGQAPADMSPP